MSTLLENLSDADEHDDDEAPEEVPVLSKTVIDTIIISDIHLGSDVCRSRDLLTTLKSFKYNRLILNGDVFDDLNFKRLSKSDWKFLSYIRKISNPKRNIEVVWVCGNHDGAADVLSHLVGVEVVEEYSWDHRGKKYLAIHGHQFDSFLQENVVISEIGAYLYLLLQKIDGEQQKVSRWVKKRSKIWLRVSDKGAKGALRYAKERGADFVFCGHTHITGSHEEEGIVYFNSGCWTDRPSNYITVAVDGTVQIQSRD